MARLSTRVAEQLIPTWATFNGKTTIGNPTTLWCISETKTINNSEKKNTNQEIRKTILEGFQITFDKILDLKRHTVKETETKLLKTEIGKVNERLDKVLIEINHLKN